MSECSQCDGTGWMRVRIHLAEGGEEYSGVRRCICKTQEKQTAETERPGGFEKAIEYARFRAQSIGQCLAEHPELEAIITPADVLVAKLIEPHVGKAHPISIREVLQHLGDGWTDRAVKASVEKLRLYAGLQIASTKSDPGGYFLPATAAECDEYHERMVRELVKLALIACLFKPQADLVQRLRGQLELTAETERAR